MCGSSLPIRWEQAQTREEAVGPRDASKPVRLRIRGRSWRPGPGSWKRRGGKWGIRVGKGNTAGVLLAATGNSESAPTPLGVAAAKK